MSERIYKPGAKGWKIADHLGGKRPARLEAPSSAPVQQKEGPADELRRPPALKKDKAAGFDPYNTCRHDKKRNRWRG